MSIREALAGTRGLWLRQVSDTGEGTIAGIIATMQAYVGGPLVLYLKVCDGTTWQGDIDAKTPIHSLADVQAVARQCVAAGIGFCPVIVPRGGAKEAAQHAAIAGALGVACFDLEAGAGFWDQSSTAGIPAYCQAIRQQAPNAYLIVQPDPRNLSAVHVPDGIAGWDCIAAQHYIGWTDVGWTDVVAEVARFDAIHVLGFDCIPTLYGVGNAGMVATFWRAVADQSLAVQAFAFGSMSGPQLRAFGALPMPALADCSAVEQQLAAEQTRNAALVAAMQSSVATLQGAIS